MYLNTNSTTEVNERVLSDFIYAAKTYWHNPSDVSQDGLCAKQIIHEAQEKIANSINAKPNEIVFTSGGSESNNWAIKGYLDSYAGVKTIITTEIEHPSVYNVCEYLKTKGYKVYYAPINECGQVDVEKLEYLIVSKCLMYSFVSIMMANNEIGTINDIAAISKVCHKYGCILHTDAVQAYMHINIDVEELGIDLMSTSFHKFGGFKNCGFLYIRDGIELTPLIHGGHQFESRRSGTENVPAIYAMGKQVKRLSKKIETNRERAMEMSRYFKKKIIEKCGKVCQEIYLNGDFVKRLPTNLSYTFCGVNAEQLITFLDMKNIQVSAGSACCAGEPTPSKVLKAIGLSDENALSTIRISFDPDVINKEMIDEFVDTLAECIQSLKMVS